MNYTQNRKIMQVTEMTLVVGVDIGSQWHYARAFDWRGIELTRKVFRFSNDLDLQLLLEDYSKKKEQLDRITAALQEKTLKVPNVEKLLAVKGVGIITVAGFLAEVGDIRRFTSPKQIQKLAGLEPKENSSGKHKGRSSISKRGRRKLRRLLFQVVLPLIRSNEDFRDVYTYYTTRKNNPLKGMQAMIAVSCKVIRIFYALLTHGMDYSSTRFHADIIRPEPAKAA